MVKKHTYNLGIIGNCAYLTQINTKANIVWMCWPKFDSSFIFGKLLDDERGGHFSISPPEEVYTTNQYYIPNTNVLCTEFQNAEGRFRVTDFAPRFNQYERHYKPLMLVRKIEPLEGQPRIKIACRPTGDYGKITPVVNYGSNHILYSGLERELRLTTNVPLNCIVEETSYILSQTKYLVLTWGIHLEAPLQATAEDFLNKTIQYWKAWVRNCNIENMWQNEVIRSAITLKLHQYEDTGAIIASSTTSLPEAPGSGRTWDYRYCWMRDTFYTLKALNDIGHFDELENYASYIQNIAFSATNRYNPVYSIHGRDNFEEEIVDLDGYLGNKPVRIGNQAKEHIQNDVYGQILVSLLPLYVEKRLGHVESTSRSLIMRLLYAIEYTMDEPDAGLWEFRHKAQRHCYTFLFHWAGSNAALKIAQHLGDEKMAEKAQKLIEQSAAQIEACWQPDLGAYSQAIETKNMDASLLQLITLGYLDPQSDRAKSHLAALENSLMTENGLFYRYLHEDDFGKPEVTFLVCSFWYVDALACVGRLDDAINCLEGLLKYTNHLGLLSEDVDAKTGSQWGNFPQTYSHVGLMNAAFRIARKLDRPDFLVSDRHFK
jgi:GH15 family glucan-1,4-alpha-glucosidase